MTAHKFPDSCQPADVRELTADDLPQCTALGLSFYEEGDLPGRFLPAVFERNWRTFLGMGIGKIVGAWEDGKLVGVIGGMLVPDVNDDEMVASEMFWYVLPKSRGVGLRLLRIYTKKMKEAGAKRMTMVHLSGLMPERLCGLYRRLGLEPLEVHYKGVLA